MKKKNNAWIWIIAALTAIVGAAVALAIFAKRTGKKLQKDLDFDDSIYFEDDDEDMTGIVSPAAVSAAESEPEE